MGSRKQLAFDPDTKTLERYYTSPDIGEQQESVTKKKII